MRKILSKWREKMFENIPEMIKKKLYNNNLYFCNFPCYRYFTAEGRNISWLYCGSLIALLNTYLLILGAYKIIYIKANGKIGGTFEFIKRMIIFCIGVLFVVYISKKYYADSVLRNIVATGAGSLSLNFQYL